METVLSSMQVEQLVQLATNTLLMECRKGHRQQYQPLQLLEEQSQMGIL